MTLALDAFGLLKIILSSQSLLRLDPLSLRTAPLIHHIHIDIDSGSYIVYRLSFTFIVYLLHYNPRRWILCNRKRVLKHLQPLAATDDIYALFYLYELVRKTSPLCHALRIKLDLIWPLSPYSYPHQHTLNQYEDPILLAAGYHDDEGEMDMEHYLNKRQGCISCEGASPVCNCAANEQCILTGRYVLLFLSLLNPLYPTCCTPFLCTLEVTQ